MQAVALLMAVLAGSELSAQAPEGVNPIDPSAVAAFADEFFPTEMARRQIPGAVFVFVSGGDIAVARGFGVAQLEPRRPVDPDRTVFRLASVSKVITATAALQLVERGLVDLHTDVNSYLKSFRLDAARGQITLHHLLTHTAGFDERLLGVGARSAHDVQPSSQYLARSMPPTFIEPGRVISYSNHGFALVGQIVEDVSGRPFADYVRDEVFQPLGMGRSGALTARIPIDLAVAYEFADGEYRELSPDYLQVASAGFFFTTGTDMARFLIAHLRGRTHENGRILQPETVALMHAQHFTQTPNTPGWGYGLWEDVRGGERALLHDGGGKGYKALMYLLPRQNAGFFLAYNLADRHEDGVLHERLITRFRQQFVSRQPQGAPRVYEHQSTEQFVGDYLYVRRARTTMEKFISVVNRLRIARGENGTLTMTGASGDPITLTATAPQSFRRADDRGVVEFESIAGSTAHRLVLITDSGFPAVYERIPMIGTLRAQVTWIAGMVLLFLYAAIWRPLAVVIRGSDSVGWNARRWSTWLGGVASALNLVFLVAFPLAFLGRMEGGVPELLYGVPAVARALLFIPLMTATLGIGTAITVVGVWRDGRTSMKGRLAHSVVAIALLSFVVFAWYWRLLMIRITWP